MAGRHSHAVKSITWRQVESKTILTPKKLFLFLNIRTRQRSGKNMTVNVMIISILKEKINCMDICSNGFCMGFCCGLTLIVSWFYFSGPDIMKSPLLRIQCTKPIWYIKKYMFSDRATKFACKKRKKIKNQEAETDLYKTAGFCQQLQLFAL